MSKIKFITESKKRLSHEDYITLRNLYTPIIGINSVTLYSILNDYNYINKDNPSYNEFDDIVKTLGISLDDLFIAKNKLEAVGLLRTFERERDKSFLFLLNAPLIPDDFKKNTMLKDKCLSKIGEIIFNRICFAFKEQKIVKNGFDEVTKKYQDIFDIIKIENDNTLEMPIVKFQNKNDAIKGLTSTQFVKYLTGNTVTPSQLKLIQRIRNNGLTSCSINEIISYTYDSNGKFVSNHVEKIASDMISKGITLSTDIEIELKAAREHQNSLSHSANSIVTSNDIEEKNGELSWNDIFETLGGEL
ncbi:MAG: DnaD domain protein [Mycoplasmatales bacterium]|nr:DnaD domain protein [Mycoplasmatales bacterium]